ncbi:hypothetical protein H6F90_24190 [Trichocoleus sp. FACHB-591]|uniref:hypothetical protein n=1 Tax=Trichocoleus sp. FACHB-591 TaxID=2692872 RepID=UPI001688C274|nr:hypothetical protein [Trichocoleus sp. FACHB-591]MBD2098173.1 hypothetical protein [Trichocoleus sp. FACHB-591]
MKLNANVALTLVLLTLMFGAGLVSAAWGFALGRQALRGITQPDVRPTSKLVGRDKNKPLRREEVMILKEEDILKRVKGRIEGKDKADDAPANKDRNKALSDGASSDSDSKTAIAQPGFPVVGRDQDVSLEVDTVQKQGGSLLLNVKMRNEGKQNVRFLYSFLNITDQRGRALSATAEGLPEELPPASGPFSGTVSVPMSLLDGADKLSMTLTDYPEQKLQLKLSSIPITR